MASAVYQSPGACGCPAAGCAVTVTGHVTGCSALNLPGATVEAHDTTAGGTLLGSTTTDSGGNYSLTVSGATAPHNLVIVIKDPPRFADATVTLTYATSGDPGTWKCGATSAGVDAALSAAAAYVCYGSLCALPIKRILQGSAGHAFTLTYNPASDRWWGTTTYTVIKLVSVTTAAPCDCNTTVTPINVTYEFPLSPGAGTPDIGEYWGRAEAGLCDAYYLDSTPGPNPTVILPTYDPSCVAHAFGAMEIRASDTNSLICPPAFSWSGTVTSPGTGGSTEPPYVGLVTLTE